MNNNVVVLDQAKKRATSSVLTIKGEVVAIFPLDMDEEDRFEATWQAILEHLDVKLTAV